MLSVKNYAPKQLNGLQLLINYLFAIGLRIMLLFLRAIILWYDLFFLSLLQASLKIKIFFYRFKEREHYTASTPNILFIPFHVHCTSTVFV